MVEKNQFNMVGRRIVDAAIGQLTFEKGYGGNNSGYYYKNEEVFRHGDPDEYCYISEHGAEYSRNDILAITGGNEEYAEEIFYSVDWQSIDTYVDEDLNEGEVYRCSNTECSQLHRINDTYKCPKCGMRFEGIKEEKLQTDVFEICKNEEVSSVKELI